MTVRIDRLRRLAAEVGNPAVRFDVGRWSTCLCGLTAQIPEFVAAGVRRAPLAIIGRDDVSGGFAYGGQTGLAAFMAFYGVTDVDAILMCSPMLYVDRTDKLVPLRMIARLDRMETAKGNKYAKQSETDAGTVAAKIERAAVAFVDNVRARASAMVEKRFPFAARHELATGSVASPQMAAID